MKNYSISRLNKVAHYGKEDTSGPEPDGEYKDIGTIFYGSYRQTLADSARLDVEGNKDTKVVVIRHNEVIDTTVIFKINDKPYQVIEVLPDDEVNGLDLVTLQYAE